MSVLVASIVLFLVVACGSGDQVATAIDSAPVVPNVLVHLVDPLDDPGYYCMDVVGQGSGAQFRDALQAHTCKAANNEDQQFMHRPASGQLFMEEYGLCLQPESLSARSGLFLRDCSDTSLQDFEFDEDGFIRIGENGPDQLCVSVASGEGQRINSIHKRRDLGVEVCDGAESMLMTWAFSEKPPAEAGQGG